MPETSIIIRTRNEERWLGRCLTVLAGQTYRDFEIIIVDNESTDATVAIAERRAVQKIVQIKDYRPGDALNKGIAAARGRYIVCLSAHCLPKNEYWLANLLRGFSDPHIAGVYGRQVPVAFTPPSDKRDLLITFGRDRRRQIKDYFFHNANSAIRRSVWEKIPFDAEATNIEDRIWAKAALAADYHILYEPEAVVYHHHGIHQNNEPTRTQGTVSIIEQVEGAGEINALPAILKPEACHCVAILPIETLRLRGQSELLRNVLHELVSAQYLDEIFILADPAVAEVIGATAGVTLLARPAALNAPHITLEETLREALLLIEQQNVYPDVVLYVNYLYPFRPPQLFDELIKELQYKGLDTTFAARVDYSNYWAHDATKGFLQVGDGLKRRQDKDPLYKALYGLGTATATSVIRQGKLVGTRVGILPFDNSRYDLKYEDDSSAKLISLLLSPSIYRKSSTKYL